MEKIEIDGNRIDVEYVKKPWIRNSYLKFSDNKLVVVSRSERTMQKMITEHRTWISKHYRQIMSSVRLFDSGALFYGSKKYNVGYVSSQERARADIWGENLIVYASNHDSAERFIDKMIREDTARFAGEMSVAKAAQINETVKEVKIRRYRKWGVCKSNRTISFNYCISMLPRELQEYIVSHEVAHLKEMNHSRRFWEVVFGLCPNYRQLRRELKRYDSVRRRVYAT